MQEEIGVKKVRTDLKWSSEGKLKNIDHNNFVINCKKLETNLIAIKKGFQQFQSFLALKHLPKNLHGMSAKAKPFLCRVKFHSADVFELGSCIKIKIRAYKV